MESMSNLIREDSLNADSNCENTSHNNEQSLSTWSSSTSNEQTSDGVKGFNFNDENIQFERNNNKEKKNLSTRFQERVKLSNVKNGLQLGWAYVAEPNPNTIHVRSEKYATTQHKQTSDNIVFSLAHCDCFKTNERIDHIAKHPSSWYYQNIDPNDNNIFTIIMQMQITTIQATLVTYHYLNNDINHNPKTDDKKFNKLFEKFLNCDDQFRASRLKLIPRIVDGPFPVRKAVENRPVLLATKVKHRYFQGKNYLEIDAQVDESYVAQAIIKLCSRFSKRIVVDLSWVLQGEDEDELPERVMFGVTFHKIDFDKVSHINQQNDNQTFSSISNSSQYQNFINSDDCSSHNNDDKISDDSNNNNNNNYNNDL